LLLSEADQYANGEERRLFYVAMTRAKERTYFIPDKSLRSKFIEELDVDARTDASDKCPSCVTADLVKRSGSKNGKEWAYYTCSNTGMAVTIKSR
jgi:DNA helicase-4